MMNEVVEVVKAEVLRGPRGEVGSTPKTDKQKRINKLARKARAITRNS